MHGPHPSPSVARRALAPLARFLKLEAASGVILLFVTIAALLWANSAWVASYEKLWAADVTFGIGDYLPVYDLKFWINDGFMTLFFLVVGLEIRRELHDGALRSLRLASLPLAAAAGGIVVPALLYLAIARHPDLQRGWAVPTATDIAFALGVLLMLGSRVPATLRVLLLALAIIDDIVAILIIALYYSDGIGLHGLLIAACGLGSVLLLQQLRALNAFVYLLPVCVVWIGLLNAGVHPTLAGVAVGLLIPIVPTARGANRQSPSATVGSALHPWVAYAIMPLFAFANAGVEFSGITVGDDRAATLALAVLIALALGKPLGIVGGCALAVKLGLSTLPQGASWRGILLVGCLGGIGFTMSIFIAGLAFAEPELLAAAKLAILIASATAAVVGFVIGATFLDRAPRFA